ncbi:GAF domain-containing protein [Nocardioides sp. YR527]|uniref:GAF domain-containing protein n=1 Tax=Nocardioides sp. YR527 TaxID=1881028 RepID=UPI00087F6CA9|nr:GAF domain-containing protein [Nocardioides sp. YR527]SDK49829.1 GAF domain-containing protein [Nocardioides sp. YR527]
MARSGRWDVNLLLTRATAEDTRADTAAAHAAEAELRATRCTPEMHELHVAAASVHRRNEALHRATARLHRSLARRVTTQAVGASVVMAISEETEAPDVALLLLTSDGAAAGSQATDGLGETAQDLELVHGEGPSRSAWSSRQPVQNEGDEIVHHWRHLGPPLRGLGISTVLAVPIRARHGVLGALTLYNPPARMLGGSALQGTADAFALLLARTIDVGQTPDSIDLADIDGVSRLHRAAGVVAVDCDCSIDDALALIRARSFVEDCATGTIVTRVLSGDLRL